MAPNSWQEIIAGNKAGIFGRFPYVMIRDERSVSITMPPLTQTLGPCLSQSSAKYAKQLGIQKDLFNEIISKLPKYDYFSQNFHYSVTNWLPFYWKGFNQTTRYTYVIEDISDLQEVWRGFLDNIRSDIRKAEKQLEVQNDLEIDLFLNTIELTFKRQNIAFPYSRDLVRMLDVACKKRQACRNFVARDAQDRIHAVVYLVWDENSAYYLMGGGDPDLRNSGAHSLLLWKAIQFASTVTNKFDFEGSMLEPVERFFRAFGAKQIPYFQITKTNLPVGKFDKFKRCFSTLFGR